MPIFEVKAGGLTKLDQTTLAAENLWERRDLQAYLRQHLNEIDGTKDLLVIAEEFADWADSKRRIDLLAVDRRGNLVVIELKRGITGEHMELQAVRYAAMVSTLTLDQAAQAFAGFRSMTGEATTVDVARDLIVEHIDTDEPEEEFGRDVRIVLVSEDFSLEVTSAIMWLSVKGIDITAIRLAVHKLEDRILLDFLQVIPFKGAEDYQVRVRNKEQAEQEIRRNKVAWNGEWYFAYGGRPWDEARKYGFVSAGGQSPSGRLYSRGLSRLTVGSRIWVHAPGRAIWASLRSLHRQSRSSISRCPWTARRGASPTSRSTAGEVRKLATPPSTSSLSNGSTTSPSRPRPSTKWGSSATRTSWCSRRIQSGFTRSTA